MGQDADLADFERLFNAGEYFEAHERLEDRWRAAIGNEKLFLQGLIQVAAAYHRFQQDPRSPGGDWLRRKGLEKLEKSGRPGVISLEPVPRARLRRR